MFNISDDWSHSWRRTNNSSSTSVRRARVLFRDSDETVSVKSDFLSIDDPKEDNIHYHEILDHSIWESEFPILGHISGQHHSSGNDMVQSQSHKTRFLCETRVIRIFRSEHCHDPTNLMKMIPLRLPSLRSMSLRWSLGLDNFDDNGNLLID